METQIVNENTFISLGKEIIDLLKKIQSSYDLTRSMVYWQECMPLLEPDTESIITTMEMILNGLLSSIQTVSNKYDHCTMDCVQKGANE